MFPSYCWQHYEEVARIRIETMLIESIEKGAIYKDYGNYGANEEGELGTWTINIFEHFTLKDELINIINEKLFFGDDVGIEYVFTYIFKHLHHLEKVDSTL